MKRGDLVTIVGGSSAMRRRALAVSLWTRDLTKMVGKMNAFDTACILIVAPSMWEVGDAVFVLTSQSNVGWTARANLKVA